MVKTTIPQTDSIEALAQFWQTHEITEFEDELEEVTEPVFVPKPESSVRIRLQIDEIEIVKRIANTKGIGYTTLLQEWVREKLQAT